MIEVDLEGATIKGVNPAQNYVKSANFEGARLDEEAEREICKFNNPLLFFSRRG